MRDLFGIISKEKSVKRNSLLQMTDSIRKRKKLSSKQIYRNLLVDDLQEMSVQKDSKHTNQPDDEWEQVHNFLMNYLTNGKNELVKNKMKLLFKTSLKSNKIKEEKDLLNLICKLVKLAESVADSAQKYYILLPCFFLFV